MKQKHNRFTIPFVILIISLIGFIAAVLSDSFLPAMAFVVVGLFGVIWLVVELVNTVSNLISYRRRANDEEPAPRTSAPYGEDDSLPEYAFTSAAEYKDELTQIRAAQRLMVRGKTACDYPANMMLEGSLQEGARLVDDYIKLMLRAFDSECTAIIDKVTMQNYESSNDKITRSWSAINHLGERFRISIRTDYLNLKREELALAYKYQLFKADEKERIRQIREDEREKARVEKELNERRAKIAKDQQHVATELASLADRASTAEDPAEREKLRDRITELNQYAVKLSSDLQEVESRAQQARAGYVYVISNIGSFGENVYKIGMTRRLDPQERIDELGDASVPFRFDVHAMIFTEDAVALETALHQRFADRRINMVNPRKEFFRVTLDEVRECVSQNYSRTVEFTETAAAYEYRQTLALVRSQNAA